MFTESLLAAALTFSAWYGDTETADERAERLHMIAQSINDATLHAVCKTTNETLDAEYREGDETACQRVWYGTERELAFLLLAQAYFETRLARHVHEGRCRTKAGECDGGKATSLWQLQAGRHLPRSRWRKLGGATRESTTLAAYEAARALGRGRNHCKSLRGAVSLYATGKSCSWQPAAERVSFMQRLAARH